MIPGIRLFLCGITLFMSIGMDFLKKYFTGQLNPHEEEQVQDWLIQHSEDPQVHAMLLEIMSEMETYDMQKIGSGQEEPLQKVHEETGPPHHWCERLCHAPYVWCISL